MAVLLFLGLGCRVGDAFRFCGVHVVASHVLSKLCDVVQHRCRTFQLNPDEEDDVCEAGVGEARVGMHTNLPG